MRCVQLECNLSCLSFLSSFVIQFYKLVLESRHWGLHLEWRCKSGYTTVEALFEGTNVLSFHCHQCHEHVIYIKANVLSFEIYKSHWPKLFAYVIPKSGYHFFFHICLQCCICCICFLNIQPFCIFHRKTLWRQFLTS